MDNALTLDEFEDAAPLVEAQAAAYPLANNQDAVVQVTYTPSSMPTVTFGTQTNQPEKRSVVRHPMFQSVNLAGQTASLRAHEEEKAAHEEEKRDKAALEIALEQGKHEKAALETALEQEKHEKAALETALEEEKAAHEHERAALEAKVKQLEADMHFHCRSEATA